MIDPDPGASGAVRQRHLLSIPRLPGHLGGYGHPNRSDPPVHAPDQREGRGDGGRVAAGVGLSTSVRLLGRASCGARPIPAHLQSPPTARRARRRQADRQGPSMMSVGASSSRLRRPAGDLEDRLPAGARRRRRRGPWGLGLPRSSSPGKPFQAARPARASAALDMGVEWTVLNSTPPE